MKWARLLEIVGNESIFSSGILRAGRYDTIDLGRQLSRWSRGERLVQLRRGLYALAPPYRKTTPHPFLIANRLRRGSYVSLQSALEYYGLIPEHSPNVTSVATGRTETLSIKIELDTHPPARGRTETTVVRRHVLLRLMHYDRAALLAGKLHAVLTRPYTKGRDLYGLLWYLSDPGWPAPDLDFLGAALT
jgi:hypothetical protein